MLYSIPSHSRTACGSSCSLCQHLVVSRLGPQVMCPFSLQSPNILLTDTGVCKVADVGLGKMLASEVGMYPVCPC